MKVLKADHKSKQYRLEDNVLKRYPEEIERNKGYIAGFQADMETLAQHPHPKEGFVGMTIRVGVGTSSISLASPQAAKLVHSAAPPFPTESDDSAGTLLTDKANAGAALLAACKDITSIEPVEFGSYRGLKMALSVENFGQDYTLTLKGRMSHRVKLGKDAIGNFTRIENVLAAIPTRLENVNVGLENLYRQMEEAKAEIGKPFPQEAELREKSARLAELNAQLDIDSGREAGNAARSQPQPQRPLAKSERPPLQVPLKALKETEPQQIKPTAEKPKRRQQER